MSTQTASATMNIFRGATYRRTVTWKDSNKVPIDLTGYTATLVIRRRVDSTVVVTLTSSPPAGLTLGGVAGTIAIKIGATQTMTLAIGIDYIWDIRLVQIGDPDEATVLMPLSKANVRATANSGTS